MLQDELVRRIVWRYGCRMWATLGMQFRDLFPYSVVFQLLVHGCFVAFQGSRQVPYVPFMYMLLLHQYKIST